MEAFSNSNIHLPQDGRIIKMFCVVGLDENKITNYSEDDVNTRYVQKIDVVRKNMRINLEKLDYENEKW